MEWEKFIDENRAMIDEFLGENQETYIMIALKGKLATAVGQDVAFKYIELWNRLGLEPQQVNVKIRDILSHIGERPIDVKDITPEEKKIYLKTLWEEFM